MVVQNVKASASSIAKLALVAVSLALVVAVVLSVYESRRPEVRYERAQVAQHASPPMGQTALRQYDASIVSPTPSPDVAAAAMFQKATILDHGILQGPEPVVPNPAMAIGYYRQVAMVGNVRERAQARDRLVELGDHLFLRRVRALPAVAARPVALEPSILPTFTRLLRPQRPREPMPTRVSTEPPPPPRSDAQNVHDSSVVKSVKRALDHLPPSPLSTENTLIDVRKAMLDAGDEDALRGLDLVEKNTVPLTALKMTEVEVLRRVWGRIQQEPDPQRRKDMVEMLQRRLHECGEEASCASGRVARVVDALSTFDPTVHLRPLWALRQEMLTKASHLRSNRTSTSRPLMEHLRETFTQDYVHAGLMTAALLHAELASWGEDLE